MTNAEFIQLARAPRYPKTFWKASLLLAALLAAFTGLARIPEGLAVFEALAGLGFLMGLLYMAHTAMRHVTYARIVANLVREPSDQNGRKWTATREGLSESVLKPFRTNWLPSKKWMSGAELLTWTFLCEYGLAVLATTEPAWSWSVWLPALVSALFVQVGYTYALYRASVSKTVGAYAKALPPESLPETAPQAAAGWLCERETWAVVKGIVFAAALVTVFFVLHRAGLQ